MIEITIKYDWRNKEKREIPQEFKYECDSVEVEKDFITLKTGDKTEIIKLTVLPDEIKIIYLKSD